MRSVVGRALGAHFYGRPVFLVGAGRSGTIVLYKALGTHPQIFTMPSEDPLITSFASIVSLFEAGPEKEYYRESVKLPKDHLYRQLRRLCFESAAGPHYGFKTLVKFVLRNRWALYRKRFWCVKTFPLEDHSRSLLKLYPDARFVYLVRNGLDVVRSRTRFPAFREQEFSQHCEVWANAAPKSFPGVRKVVTRRA